MDLERLRRAALQTKKRKRQQQQPSASPEDDREEGEIDDGTPAPAPPASVDAGLLAVPEAPRVQHHPPVIDLAAPAPVPAPLTPATLHALKEDSKAIIAELLTYSVPPDYLLSIGVSRDILEISFHELGLHLTLPPPATSFPLSVLSPQSLLPAHSSSPLSPSLLLDEPPAPPAHAAPATAPDLSSLEALKRAELLARKAALVARNQERAQTLEAELDTLFALAQPSPPPTAPQDGAETVAQSSARAFASTSARRPLATELEAEPAGPMSAQALALHRSGPAYLAHESSTLVIELSDDDDDDDEGGGGPDDGPRGSLKSANSAPVAPNGTSRASRASRSPTIAKAPLPASTDAYVLEDGRKVELETKDRELQRLKERIAALERRKEEAMSRKTSADPPPSQEARGGRSMEASAAGPEPPQAQAVVSFTVPSLSIFRRFDSPVTSRARIGAKELHFRERFVPTDDELAEYEALRAPAVASSVGASAVAHAPDSL
ncbi:hypothetical protein JCM10207_006243 [Rhodosporidiobolus poonsookiae]